MKNINIINNTGKNFDVVLNENNNGMEIIINLANDEFKLSKNLKSGDTFKDVDGDEYILLFYLPNGDAAILSKDSVTKMEFGSNNNYNGSNIDKYLCDTYLLELERKFGKENIVEHEVDLLSLDGEDDYGKIKRKVSLLTLDEYRANKKAIKKYINEWFWLATPNSTPNGCSSGFVHCVGSVGNVGYGWYDGSKAVRPFWYLKASVFEK